MAKKSKTKVAVSKELLDRYENGVVITDDEARALLKFFSDMEQGCLMLGPKFHLFKNEMRANHEVIDNWFYNRKYA